MKNHGRKYGEKDSHPIPLWNGVFDHYDRILGALWEFAWCIDRVTEERDGIGMVLGGAPVRLRTIAGALRGSKKETVRRHMDTLEENGYIRRRRTPYGHVIEVLNSRKFEIWKPSKEKPQNDVSLGIEKPIYGSEKPTGGSEKPQKVVYKEDSAGTQQEDSAERAACPVWKETGVDPLRLIGPFRKLCEDRWAVRNGSSLFDFMGDVLDSWQVLEGPKCKHPPAWVRRKSELGRLPQKQTSERPELEAIPWKK